MIQNPRFPHGVLVYRDENIGTSDAPDIVPKKMLDSPCRNYLSNKGSEKNGVAYSDYTLALPRSLVDVLTGDRILVFDQIRTIKGDVVACQITNFGVNIYYNEVKN